MNEFMQEWVVALRSGEYEQGRGQLAVVNDDGKVAYCCLGVACELAAQKGLINRVKGVDMIGYKTDDMEWSETSGLPPRVTELMDGKVDGSGHFPGGKEGSLDGTHARSLIGMNDSDKNSFEEIADKIEQLWGDKV